MGGFLRGALHPAMWHPASKEPGRFWKRKLVGWREHLLRTTILTGRVIGVKRNGSVCTFPSGRE